MAVETKNYDLKALNPGGRSQEDTRTPEELLDLIETRSREAAERQCPQMGTFH